MTDTQSLRETPLHGAHLALNARMVPFSGWSMPVQYASVLEEVDSVREGCGMFDVSHMGRVWISGTGAGEFVSSLFSADVSKLGIGRAKYGVTCDESGGIIDDNIVYRVGARRYLYIPNAGNRGAALDWLRRWAPNDGSATIKDASDSLAMIAVQGPEAERVLGRVAASDLSKIRPFRIRTIEIDGQPMLAARTGYTGEDGFEIMPPAERARRVWDALRDAGARPCGLASRDLLRLEAGLLLHGNDMDTTVNPYEAGLERFVDADREGYVAGAALRKIRDEGVARRLVGFEVIGRRIARAGYEIFDADRKIGDVTSGSISFTLDKNIGLGYVPSGHSAPGSRLLINVRGRMAEAVVRPLPFYSRSMQ